MNRGKRKVHGTPWGPQPPVMGAGSMDVSDMGRDAGEGEGSCMSRGKVRDMTRLGGLSHQLAGAGGMKFMP